MSPNKKCVCLSPVNWGFLGPVVQSRYRWLQRIAILHHQQQLEDNSCRPTAVAAMTAPYLVVQDRGHAENSHWSRRTPPSPGRKSLGLDYSVLTRPSPSPNDQVSGQLSTRSFQQTPPFFGTGSLVAVEFSKLSKSVQGVCDDSDDYSTFGPGGVR